MELHIYILLQKQLESGIKSLLKSLIRENNYTTISYLTRIGVEEMKRILRQSLLILGSVMLLVVGSTQTATIPYAVDDYIPVLFKDARLFVAGSLELNGNGNESSNDSAGGSAFLYQKSFNENDYLDFGADLYYQRKYTTIEQWYEYYGQINGDIRTTKNKNGGSYTTLFGSSSESEYETKSTRLIPYTSHSIDVGKYLSGDLMLSLQGAMNYQYDKTSKFDQSQFEQSINVMGNNATRRTYTLDSEDPGDTKSLNLDASLLFGQGRMYDGVFAFTAISMIEELERKGLLLRVPTREEMEELTEIVYQNRLLHSIDFRIRRIEILNEIDSYLSSKGIIELSNPMTAPVVRDVWDYFPTYSREFGLMVRGGVGIMHNHSSSQFSEKSAYRDLVETYDITNPGVVTIQSDNSGESHLSSYQKSIGTFPYATVVVEKNQPLTTRVQLNLAAQGWLYFSTKDTMTYKYWNYADGTLLYSSSSHEGTEYESATRFALSADLLYVFDNRTTARMYGSYQRIDYDRTIRRTEYFDGVLSNSDTLTTDVGGYNLNIGGQLEYRISIPTTLTASVSYYKNTAYLFSGNIGDRESDNYRFTLRITHYLF